MVIFFAFLFSFSFAQYAQESPSWLVNQEYYDLKCYPTDAHTKITFEQAQRRLAQNSHDQQAFVALNNLAFRQNPYIPAVRLLAGQALRNGDFNHGFALVSMGQAAGDLPCIYSKASLLLNAQHVPCLAYADPYMAESEAQHLLQYAAGTVDFSTPGKIKKYYIPGAVHDLEQIKQESNYRLWTAFEKSLDRMPAGMRQTFVDQARAHRLFHESCYCIKKLLPENPDSALEWSADLIGAPDFNYDQFMSNGTYQAVQTLANDTNHPAHAKAAFLLGYLDYARLREGQSVDISTLERNLTVGADHDIRALLMLASYADTKEDLKLYADQIVHRLDEIDARLYGTVIPDIVQLYYAIMKSEQTKFVNGLVKLLKHDAFKTTRDELAKDPHLAAQVGMQLLEIRDQLTIDAASKGRADYRKIHDAGLALTKAAAESLHDGAAWALVAHSLHPYATESQKNKLDEHVAQAMMSTQTRLERGMPLLSAASDVMHTLEKLQTTASLSQESCHALAHWYINGVPGLLARDELKAIEYLSRVDNFVVPLQEAFEQGKINDPRACLRAGILMHQKSALIGTRNQLFIQAITHGSLAEKKQAALYCVEHKDLIGHACSALTLLFEEHARVRVTDEAQAGQLREQVLTPVFNTLLSWAVGSHKGPQGDTHDCHPDAIMFFYKSPFTAEFTIQDKEKIDRLVERAAFMGHKEAIDVLEPKFTTIEKDAMAIIKAVDYWQSWLNLYQQDPQKKEAVDRAYSYLKIVSDWALEPHEKNSLPVLAINTHYRLGQIFMDRDPVRAVNHILLIEEIVKRTGNNLPKAAQQIASVGLYDILEKKAREGVDWACYVLAHVHINRLKILTDQNVENHKLCFERIDTIKELFEKSKTFDTARLDPRLRTLHRAQKGRPALTLAEIEYHEAEMARVLNQLSNRPDPATFERWLKMLHASADKFFPEAMFSLAGLILDGELHRGQDALERAVYLLCAAAETGLKDAQDSLADVARQGLALRAPCGGNMTESLHSQIQQSLQKIGLTPAVQPIVSDQNLLSTEFERALSDFNQKKMDQALPAFARLSAAGDVRATVYLGIMYRDGIGVERSALKAEECFVGALKNCKDKEIDTSHLQVLSIALEATKNMTERDLELEMQRLRLVVHVQQKFSNHYKFDVLMDRIESAEKKLRAADQTDLLYRSGLLDELIRISATTDSLNERLRIAKLCAQRCHEFKPEVLAEADEDILSQTQRNSDARLILLPVSYLRDMIAEAVLGMTKAPSQFINQALIPLFADVEAKHIIELANVLEALVAKGYIHPFQEILGSLKMVKALYDADSKLAQEARKNWESAAKNGSLRAAYMLALSNLRGDEIGKIGLIDMNDQIRVKQLYTYAPSLGEAQLLELAAKKYATTYPLLANWYYQKGDYSKALDWYRKMRDDLPENDLGAVGYLDTMVRAFSKIDEHDAERMRIAISIPHRQPVSIVRSSLATCYLRLFKRIEGITDEQALDLIIKNAPHFIHMSAKDMHIFLKETHFCTKLSQLIESADPQLKLTDPHVIAKAYVVKAYLMSLDYQKSKDGSTDAVELAMIDACDKALKLNEDLLEAHVIKAMAYQSLGVKGNDEAMSQMQRALIKATLVMDKHHFKLKDVYLFKTLIHMVKMQGWKTSWIAALEEKYGDKKEVA